MDNPRIVDAPRDGVVGGGAIGLAAAVVDAASVEHSYAVFGGYIGLWPGFLACLAAVVCLGMENGRSPPKPYLIRQTRQKSETPHSKTDILGSGFENGRLTLLALDGFVCEVIK